MLARLRSRVIGWALSIAAIGALAGCDLPGFTPLAPADEQGRHVASLWRGVGFVALAVGVTVWGLIGFAVIRYRRRRDTPEDAIPSQQSSSGVLEVIYTVIPLVIVAVLFVLTTTSQRKINAVSTRPDLTVRVTAFQWGWQFTYPTGATVVSGDGPPPELVLPLGQVVEIDLVATDVVHAFYVPSFLFQRNAVPGTLTRFNVTPTKLGTFGGKCSTYCSIGHSKMLFEVRVLAADAFKTWLDAQPARAGSS